MPRVALVAVTVFRGILSKRALYAWAAAVVLMLLRSGPPMFMKEQSAQLTAFIRASAISGALDSWALLALAAAIFLGAASVGGEMVHKTIATVLARPIRRWEFMLGHWFGVTLFSIVSLGIGLVLAGGLAWYLGIAIDPGRATIALAETIAAAMMLAAIGIAIGANTSTALAAAVTVLLVFMPPINKILVADQRPFQHYPGKVLDWVTPPGYTSHYQGIAWADMPAPPNPRPGFRPRPRPVVDYPEARKRLSMNLVYGAVYFLGGVLLFTRRDVRLG